VIGILGGTFDPVHLGHLDAASQLRVAVGLTEVWLMPNCRPPHKVSPPVASPGQRLQMVELGIRGLPGLRACDLEVERGGVSYTVDTLRALRAEWPETVFTLLLGFDAALQIGAWHEVATILREASFVIFSRPPTPPCSASAAPPLNNRHCSSGLSRPRRGPTFRPTAARWPA